MNKRRLCNECKNFKPVNYVYPHFNIKSKPPAWRECTLVLEDSFHKRHNPSNANHDCEYFKEPFFKGIMSWVGRYL